MGKYQSKLGNRQLTASQISIQDSNFQELKKTQAMLDNEHPLKKEDPDSWNNIPICIRDAVSNIIQQTIEGDG